jgi:hypothetical protein
MGTHEPLRVFSSRLKRRVGGLLVAGMGPGLADLPIVLNIYEGHHDKERW